MMNQAALSQYQSVGVHSGMTDASPHQIVTMQLDGVLDRVASAKGAIARGEIQQKGEMISGAIALIDSLRASLDFDRGGEIAVNLASLYDYLERRLVEVSISSDVSALDEVTSLFLEIKEAWTSIPDDWRRGSV